MKEFSYKNLSPFEKQFVDTCTDICNGCGGKAGFINPPEFMFNASCNHHDFEYWRGGDKLAKRGADFGFYAEMLKDAKRAKKWWKRMTYKSFAWVYWRAVVRVGFKYFSFGKPKGWSDLYELMKEKGYTYGN